MDAHRSHGQSQCRERRQPSSSATQQAELPRTRLCTTSGPELCHTAGHQTQECSSMSKCEGRKLYIGESKDVFIVPNLSYKIKCFFFLSSGGLVWGHAGTGEQAVLILTPLGASLDEDSPGSPGWAEPVGGVQRREGRKWEHGPGEPCSALWPGHLLEVILLAREVPRGSLGSPWRGSGRQSPWDWWPRGSNRDKLGAVAAAPHFQRPPAPRLPVARGQAECLCPAGSLGRVWVSMAGGIAGEACAEWTLPPRPAGPRPAAHCPLQDRSPRATLWLPSGAPELVSQDGLPEAHPALVEGLAWPSWPLQHRTGHFHPLPSQEVEARGQPRPHTGLFGFLAPPPPPASVADALVVFSP